MARPKVHDAATGEALLDAAARLLQQHGPEALSVRAVADDAGISFRAVYAVFGSKQALVDALAERGYRRLASLVDGIPVTADPVDDLVAAGVDGFREFVLESPGIFRLTFEEISAEVLEQRQVARAALASYRALAARVRRAQETGAIHVGWSEEECVFVLHSLCQGLATAELATRLPPEGPGFWPMLVDQDMRQIWTAALTGLVDGFRSPPSRSPLAGAVGAPRG